MKISFDEFNSCYEQNIGQSISIDSKTAITFDLDEEKWMNLLKTLSNYKLPKIDWCQLNSVPEDSEEVRAFINRSISSQNSFWFNNTKQAKCESSKYLEALKSAASHTADSFLVD